MSIVSDIEKFNGMAFVKILDVLLVLIPGILVIFYFHPELYSNLDIFKLLFLSAAITIPPFLMIFTTLAIATGNNTTNDVDHVFIVALMSLAALNIVLYGWLFIAYIWQFSQLFYVVAVSLSVLFLVCLVPVTLAIERHLKNSNTIRNK